MPRNVRNFWVELSIDGRPTPIAGGPRNKDGGFDLVVKMRDKGGIKEAFAVNGRVLSDGRLVVTVEDQQQQFLRIESER